MKRSVAVSCWIAACVILPSMIPRAQFLAETAPEASAHVRLWEMLPESTILVVELRDFETRWGEIRNLPAIARFQDRLLAAAGARSEDLRRLLGRRALFALVAGRERDSLVPLALMRPTRGDEARRMLAALEQPPVALAVEWRGDLVAIAPASLFGRFELPSAQGRATLSRRLRTKEVDARLPEGGLVRGWFDPQAAAALLRSSADRDQGYLAERVTEAIVAELDVMRLAGFRRELTSTGLATEAVIGYDGTAPFDGTSRLWGMVSDHPAPWLRIDGQALAGLASQLVVSRTPGIGDEFGSALIELVSELEELVIEVWREDDVVRLRGRVDFR